MGTTSFAKIVIAITLLTIVYPIYAIAIPIPFSVAICSVCTFDFSKCQGGNYDSNRGQRIIMAISRRT